MDSKMNQSALTCLPSEIIIKISSFLKLSDLRNLMLTCQRIKHLLENENALWRIIANERFITIKNKRDRDSLSWYNKCRIYHNWCKGIYKTKVIIHHRESYMPWLHFSDSETLYLSVGSELRCYVLDRRGIPQKGHAWSLEVPIVKRSDGRTNDISRFIVKDNLIVCGNRDGCVAVYELTEIQRKPYLMDHITDCHANGQIEVTAVEKIQNNIITASNKSDCICFWPITENETHTGFSYQDGFKTLYCLPYNVYCKSIAANKAEDALAIGPVGYDRPMILDINTGSLTKFCTLPLKPSRVVRDIQWMNEHCVAYATYSGKLQIIDLRCDDVVYKTIDPFLSSLYCLKTDGNNIIVTGTSEYSRCVLYDIRSTYHFQMYFTQKKSSPIYCLDFDASKLIVAADRAVATVNFNARNAVAKDYSQRFQLLT